MRVPREGEWQLSDTVEPNRKTLLLSSSPEEVLKQLVSCVQELVGQDVSFEQADRTFEGWEDSARFKFVISLKEKDLYDQFFNGRAGIRAQYFLSVEEGVLFNKMVVDELAKVIVPKLAPDIQEKAERSLKGPQAKIWIDRDNIAFNEAPENQLLVKWCTQHPYGNKIPLPDKPALLLMGSFYSEKKKDYWFVERKRFRACEIHKQGSS